MRRYAVPVNGVHVHCISCLIFIYSDSDKFNANRFSCQELYIKTMYGLIYIRAYFFAEKKCSLQVSQVFGNTYKNKSSVGGSRTLNISKDAGVCVRTHHIKVQGTVN